MEKKSSLVVTRSDVNKVTRFALRGSVTQDMDFDQAFNSLPERAEIDCSGVTGINSVGVREWINFFSQVRKNGKKLRFFGCSPALVYQMNLFINFIPVDELESIQVPYLCESCSTEMTKTYTVKELLAARPEAERPACSKCGQPAVFDDIPGDYFRFLAQLKKK